MKRSPYGKKLLRRSFMKNKKSFYANLDEKHGPGDKWFWKTVKLFLYDRMKPSKKVALEEEGKL